MNITPDDTTLVDLVTIRDYIRWAVSQFTAAGLYFGHGTDNAWDEAEYLVLHAINLVPPLDDIWLDSRLTLSERSKIVTLLSQRINERIPAAYLTGRAWFAGLPFKVDERVLVPRSPIAELIQNQFEPWLTIEPEHILDLCTGSGCIGIACAYAFPEAQVDLADISADALIVARANIAEHELTERVNAYQSDLFASLEKRRYDLIVTNPPYVDAADLEAMPAEYHAEPAIGLGSGADGLDFTRRLLSEVAEHLTEEGILICEVGNSWVVLEAAFPDVPFVWLEFERGGHGVFMLSAEVLRSHFFHTV
jgi:ribosomal protein L3 glutamine methyltransferase